MSEKKSASQRYLVIEARWHEPFLERFVFALRDEDSLREPIAGSSVVGIGFGYCEGAAAVVPNTSSRDTDSKSNPEKVSVDCEGDRGGAQSPRQDLRHGVGLSETRRIAGATLQYAVAASVLVFYPRSVLGAALRALVGG